MKEKKPRSGQAESLKLEEQRSRDVKVVLYLSAFIDFVFKLPPIGVFQNVTLDSIQSMTNKKENENPKERELFQGDSERKQFSKNITNFICS